MSVNKAINLKQVTDGRDTYMSNCQDLATNDVGEREVEEFNLTLGYQSEIVAY
jgi:hypothetical protein